MWLVKAGIHPDNWSFRLDRDTLIIGRNTNCDIRIDDISVSRYHARIEHSKGKWYIADQTSTNGTYINDKRIAKADIGDGDVLRVGRISLLFVKGTGTAPNLEWYKEDKTPVEAVNRRNVADHDGVLTRQESQVAKLLVAGLSRKQIAIELNISNHTAHTHIQSIYSAYNVHSQRELMMLLTSRDAQSADDR
jgi:pSer/pThr/pTyr-binding forkhead associated (FHA) protein